MNGRALSTCALAVMGMSASLLVAQVTPGAPTIEYRSLPCAVRISFPQMTIVRPGGIESLRMTESTSRDRNGVVTWASLPVRVADARSRITVDFDVAIYPNLATTSKRHQRLISSQSPNGAARVQFTVVDASSGEVLGEKITPANILLRDDDARRRFDRSYSVEIDVGQWHDRTVELRVHIMSTSLVDRHAVITSNASTKQQEVLR